MKRQTHMKVLIALSASLLLSASIPRPGAAAQVRPGVKRCASLQSQMDAAVTSKHMVLPLRARTLAAEAQEFCSQGKTAQGVRAYVKALNLAGITPDLGTEHVATGELP